MRDGVRWSVLWLRMRAETHLYAPVSLYLLRKMQISRNQAYRRDCEFPILHSDYKALAF